MSFYKLDGEVRESMKFDFHERLNQIGAIICAIMILLISSFALFAWHYNPNLLGYFNPSGKSITQYNTALSLLLSGIALLYSIFHPYRFNLHRWLGLIIGLLGALTLLEYIWDLDLGIDQLVLKTPLSAGIVKPGRMSPLTATSLFLMGLVFFLTLKESASRWRSILRLVFGLLVCCMGVFGVLGYLTRIQTTLGLANVSEISFLAAIALIFAGSGLLMMSAYYNNLTNINIRSFYPLFIGSSTAFFGLLVILGLLAEQESSLTRDIKNKLKAAHVNLLNSLENQRFLLKILSKEIEHDYAQMADSKGNLDVLTILEKQPEYQNITWLDSDFKVKNFQNSSQSEQARIRNESWLNDENFIQAIRSLPLYEVLVEYQQSSNQLFFVHSFLIQNRTVNFLIAQIRAEIFFEDVLLPILDKEYIGQIFLGDNLIYEINGPLSENTLIRWGERESVEALGEQFIIKIFPTNFVLSQTVNKGIIIVSLVGSGILSFIMAGLVYLWQISRMYIKQLVSLTNELNANQETLDLALVAAKMGTWFWDIVHDKIHWGVFTYSLLGLKLNASIEKFEQFLALIHPDDRPRFIKSVKNSLATGQPFEFNYRIIYPNGENHYLTSRGIVYQDSEGKPLRLTGISWDTTELNKRKKFLELQIILTQIFQTSNSLKEAASKALAVIGTYLEWDIVTLWVVNEQNTSMECVDVWHAASLNISAFKAASYSIKMPKGEYFPGAVWEQFSPLWLENIKQAPHFTRMQEAVQSGIQGAFGFPILDNENFYGVIEMFRLKPFTEKVDQDYASSFSLIGSMISQFIHQKKTDEARSLLASIVEFSKDAIISKDLDDKITSWNHGAEEIFGYKAKEALGKSVRMIYPSNYVEELNSFADKLKEGESIQDSEAIQIRKDGEKIWTLTTISPLENKEAEVVGSCAIIRDITNLKEAAETLRKSEEKFRVFVETTNEWIWSIDRQRKITFSNAGIQSILGYDPETIIGTDISLFLAEDERARWDNEFSIFVLKRKGWIGHTYQWKHKNGSIKWLESNAEPILDPTGQVLGFRGADRDITERKNIEKVKNEFISLVSHELRTPLTSIKGSIGLLIGKAQDEFSERSLHLLNIAYDNCERLIRLINDILDIEKMETSKLQFHFQPVDIDEIIKKAVELSQSLAEKFKIRLIIESLSEGAKVYADPDRLMQVVSNLISNAIKFSKPEGQVWINISPSATKIRVSIKDQGIGMTEDFQSHVFEKFSQADSSSKRAMPGTGLGLHISKSIIERLGGTIGFTSKKDQGSTFYFELSKWHGELPRIHKLSTDDIFYPVLIIQSSDSQFANALKHALEKNQFSVKVVLSLNQAKILLQNHSFCLIIVDLNSEQPIPIVEKLSQLEFKLDVPVIFASQFPKPPLEMLPQEIPILAWLDKNLSAEQLTSFCGEIKNKLLSFRPKVLYVEDSQELSEVIQTVLQKDVQLIVAQTIKEAKEVLLRENIDLVLLDIYLPDGLGTELLPYMNSRTGQPIPVVIFSVREEENYGHGVQKILNKAHATEAELINAIRSLIKFPPCNEKL